MKLIIKLFGVLLIFAGVFYLFNAEMLFSWLEEHRESTSFYVFAIIMRMTIGVLLILAAKESKFPKTFRLIGSLAVITAITFIIIGHGNFQEFLSSIIADFKPYSFISGLISMGIGVFFIYASSSKKELMQE